MLTIHKFQVPVTQDEFYLTIPEKARLLHFDEQRNQGLQLWAVVNTYAPTERRRFKLYGTGYPLTHISGEYIGTAQQQYGGDVWHLFEVTDEA